MQVKLQESAEMYLETILILSQKSALVRSVDVADALDYKKPSVSVAMKKLRENGYVTVEHDGHIALTERGKEVAETIYERHNLFADWLVSLGVDRKVAAMDACRMEHVVSPESFRAIKEHVERTGTHDAY